jgi:NAD(P)-dependent dehydrogenase (short-subunit alcohol dehydrogenase family)
MSQDRLSGKIIAITGAASGVGRAVAQACAGKEPGSPCWTGTRPRSPR